MKSNTIKQSSQSGLAALEIGLLLPLLMLVVLAVFDFGRYLWAHHAVTNAAVEGARLAILHEPEDSEVRQAVRDLLLDSGILQTATVNIGSRSPGLPVSVNVSVPFDYLVLGGFVPGTNGTKQIAATSVMTCER